MEGEQAKTVIQIQARPEKTARNKRVQGRYDALMSLGHHGHYETMFRVVREEVERERERCAKVAENPGFIQATDTDWDEGVNHAKKFIAAAIRGTEEG